MTLSFARPALLLLLAVPLLLMVWVIRRRSGQVALPFDHGVAPGRGAGALRAVLNVSEMLPALLLALAVFLMAGPQRFSEPKTERMLTNIEYVVDVSCSMTASYGDGTRYDAAMTAINEFIDYRQGDAFGLTIFGNSVLHWIPLTSDVSAFRCAPPFLRPEKLPPWFGGTQIGKALIACHKVLAEREEGDRLLILLSDGYSWDLDGGRDEKIARKLAADRVTVYTVHIANGAPPDSLAVIANITGGKVFAAGDPQALEGVFKHIDEMEKAKLKKSAPEALDNFEPYCQLALALLASFLLTAFGLRYTPW